MNLIKLSKEVNQIKTNIEKSKDELNKLIRQFDTLEFNDKKFEDIKTNVAVVNQEFHKIPAEYQDSLIGKTKYTFEFMESQIEDIFGRLTDVQVNFCSFYFFNKNLYLFLFKKQLRGDFDSTILDKQNQSAINELCKFPSAKQWKLQYRATRDGFGAEDFHSKCDGFANTLTIIKSEHGNIFGGFTEEAWDSSSGCHADPKAFIFSLVNKENKPFKAISKNNVYAICCDSNNGPIFGYDIHIASDSNSKQNSYSNFGDSYKHPDYQFGTDKAKSILAGSHYFQTVDIEVFVATNISNKQLKLTNKTKNKNKY